MVLVLLLPLTSSMTPGNSFFPEGSVPGRPGSVPDPSPAATSIPGRTARAVLRLLLLLPSDRADATSCLDFQFEDAASAPGYWCSAAPSYAPRRAAPSCAGPNSAARRRLGYR